MANLNNYITTFIKISVITTLIFGGLLAQSYATNLVSNSIAKMNIEFSSKDSKNTIHQTASINIDDNQQSSFAFGDYQLDIKTTLIPEEGIPYAAQQLLAEVNVKQLGEFGQVELIGSPTKLILRNKWVEFKLDSEDIQEGIQFKLQYEDYLSNQHNAITSG